MITHASKSIFRLSYDLRKYYFTNRALNIWNSLPNHVVLSDTVNMFKSMAWINSGNIKILFMISKPKFLEPEVGAVMRD